MTTAKAKILIVDDVKDWRSTLKGLLKDNGYDADEADSYEKALELLTVKMFDLALLDLRLDETDEDNIDGLKLAEIINNRWPRVKVVMITGYGTPEILKKAMEPDPRGNRLVADYVPKDRSEEIVDTIRRVLN